MWLSKSTKGIFYVYYKNEKTNKRTRISTRSRLKKDAIKFLSDFENQKRAVELKKNAISLVDFQTLYLNAVKPQLKPSSYKNSMYVFQRFINTVGENILLQSLTKYQVENYVLNIFKDSPYSGSLSNRILKAIFNKAINWGYLEKNPLNKFNLKTPKSKPAYVDLDEFHIILEHEKDNLLSMIYEYAIFTGSRISEITNLRWCWIDMKNKLITIKNDDKFTSKSGIERTIPMSDRVFEILYQLKQSDDENEYVFQKGNKKINNNYLSKKFKAAVRKTDLNQKIHFHSLRHSFASILIKQNISIYQIKELLGHKDVKTTQVYSHLAPNDLNSAISVFNK